jgi:hypothetical protein
VIGAVISTGSSKPKSASDCVCSRDHAPPHFHALYAEYEALIDLRNFSVIRGSLPGRAMALVPTITAMNCWRIGIYAAECKHPNRSNP